MLLGEAEILGQVRDAYSARAYEGRVTGPVLNRLFQAALGNWQAGARGDRTWGTRPMGVASAGMKLAERIFGKLQDPQRALFSAAGAISEQVCFPVCGDRRIKNLYLMNRSRERAEEFARHYEGKVLEMGESGTLH